MAVIEVHSAQDERLAAYTSLTNRQLRRSLEAAHGLMICESRLVVERALERGLAPRSLLIARRRLALAEELAAGPFADVPVYVADDDAIEQLTGIRLHRGILAAFERPAPLTPEQALEGASRVCVLEASVDATNVGAIFRAAAALGADAVLLDPTCADPLERRCLRVSMGAVLSIPWARVVGWPDEGLGLLRKRGLTTVACALADDAVDLRDFAQGRRGKGDAPGSGTCGNGLALVFGTEGAGLTQSTIAACDVVCRIPMRHGIDSLNVASAAAVFLWELFA